jgi:hypothetical protein
MLLAAILFGCGDREQPATKAKGGASKSATTSSAELPSNFPKDVPILKDARIRLVISQGNRMVVQLYTSSSVNDAVKFYDLGLRAQGWTIQSSDDGREGRAFSARKDKSLCDVRVAKEGKDTVIELTLAQNAS